MSVLVLGSIGIDDIQTPTEKKNGLLGGSASFSSVAAGYFEPVWMVGAAGTDFPENYKQLYKQHHIDLAGLEIIPGKTLYWSGRYEENMNLRSTLTIELNVFEKFSPRLPKNYQDAPYVLLANISPELQANVLNQLRSPRFVIADTMDFWIKTTRPQLLELLKKINLLILNDSEAALFSGEINPLRAARWLLAQGPQFVVIRKGEHGSLLFSRDEIFAAPALLLENITDPTGAGDTFAGGLAGFLASTNDTSFNNLKKGILEGTVLASFTVEDFSLNKLANLTPQDIQNRRHALQKLMR